MSWLLRLSRLSRLSRSFWFLHKDPGISHVNAAVRLSWQLTVPALQAGSLVAPDVGNALVR